MPIIGNPIYQSAFVVDQFSGNGSTTAFTMSVAPAGVTNVLVAVSGVLQDPSTYGVVGNTITFSAAPPSGTGNISCRYLGVPASGVTTTAYRTVTEFTATASQTTFTPPSYNVGFINVYLNGVLLGSADYTATNGTTVVLAIGASAGNLLTVESFQISSVANAIPNAAGAVTSSNIQSGVTINFADGSASTPSITNDGDTNTGIFFPAADTIAFSEGGAEIARFDSSGNLGIGATSPAFKLDVRGSNQALINAANPTSWVSVDSGLNTQSMYLQANTSSSDCRVGSYTNHSLNLLTNNTSRMVINTSGYVTQPYQPTFHAVANGTGALTGTIARFPNALVNISGSYNTSTMRFTAPIAGTYYFYAAIMADTGTGRMTWQFFRNGSGISYNQGGGTSTDYATWPGAMTITLAAGDYIQVNVGSGTPYNSNQEQSFGGYLLG